MKMHGSNRYPGSAAWELTRQHSHAEVTCPGRCRRDYPHTYLGIDGFGTPGLDFPPISGCHRSVTTGMTLELLRCKKTGGTERPWQSIAWSGGMGRKRCTPDPGIPRGEDAASRPHRRVLYPSAGGGGGRHGTGNGLEVLSFKVGLPPVWEIQSTRFCCVELGVQVRRVLRLNTFLNAYIREAGQKN